MPFTALDVRPGVTRSMILEPRQNLEIGFKYLRKLLDRWKGNEALALASYNAGPAAVDRWVRAMNVNPAIDPDQPLPSPREATLELAAFIDRIPYKETRDYVGSILRNIVWYRSLLPRKASFPAESASFLLPDFWRKKTAHVALPGKKSATPKTGNADTH
jgi:soluble lytic murein transglycosylase